MEYLQISLAYNIFDFFHINRRCLDKSVSYAVKLLADKQYSGSSDERKPIVTSTGDCIASFTNTVLEVPIQRRFASVLNINVKIAKEIFGELSFYLKDLVDNEEYLVDRILSSVNSNVNVVKDYTPVQNDEDLIESLKVTSLNLTRAASANVNAIRLPIRVTCTLLFVPAYMQVIRAADLDEDDIDSVDANATRAKSIWRRKKRQNNAIGVELEVERK